MPAEAIASSEANLLKLELDYEGNTVATTIVVQDVIQNAIFPFGIDQVTIKTIQISANATSNRKQGDVIDLTDDLYQIEITAEDNVTVKNYWLHPEVGGEPDYFDLLFNQFTDKDCNNFGTIDRGELKLENNTWNSGALPSNSFNQCVYAYEGSNLQLLGWQWDYPDFANGVNAYPQIIFGWKPWQTASTTPHLPKKLSEINKLKVTYDAEIIRNDGDYNLAFDCWINSSPDIAPENIQFELMVWEESNNLVPFGDYQEDLVTTNGTYQFFMGEPTWEPAGTNWTYLAFSRIEQRSAGTVDMDEIITFLINKGITPADSYLATVEFGNEIGNSTGQTVIKAFEVAVE